MSGCWHCQAPLYTTYLVYLDSTVVENCLSHRHTFYTPVADGGLCPVYVIGYDLKSWRPASCLIKRDERLVEGQ